MTDNQVSHYHVICWDDTSPNQLQVLTNYGTFLAIIQPFET